MKRFSSSSPDSSEVCPPICSTQEEKPAKRKQIYSKEFQEMLDKLDREELDPGEEGLVGFGGAEKKRRLSGHQVKALERSFEKDNKLEPQRKNRLAQELELQPRQVAIWFQNRRARWKTKQLERDYGVLESDYDSLRAAYDYLDQENKSLLSQLTELKMKLKQQVRVPEIDLDRDRHEECPVSESAVVVKPQFGYGSEIDASSNSDALVKDEILEEEEPYLFPPEEDAVMPMSSPNNNTSTASSGSSYTTSREPAILGSRVVSEDPPHVWLNFFSVDHAPTLHCYFAEDDGN